MSPDTDAVDPDEIDLAILDIYDMTSDAGVSLSQARLMLREAVDRAYQIVSEMDDLRADDDVPRLLN